MTNERRIEMEREIVAALATEAVAQGWSLHAVDRIVVASVDEVLQRVFDLDEAHLIVTRPAAGGGRQKSWFYFVLGNTGYDVLSDYGTSLDSVVDAVEPLIARLEAEAVS
jgi:hypothetical protein